MLKGVIFPTGRTSAQQRWPSFFPSVYIYFMIIHVSDMSPLTCSHSRLCEEKGFNISSPFHCHYANYVKWEFSVSVLRSLSQIFHGKGSVRISTYPFWPDFFVNVHLHHDMSEALHQQELLEGSCWTVVGTHAADVIFLKCKDSV